MKIFFVWDLKNPHLGVVREKFHFYLCAVKEKNYKV